MKAKNKKTWISILVLITIDQTIKIIINNNFLDQRFPILPPLLYFEPMFNRHYSWFNSMLQFGIGKWLLIALVGSISILIYLFYQFLNKRFGAIIVVDIMFAFIFSGAICSLIDKAFWNGSLDYILVNSLFTFDLKDVYINIFNGFLILLVFLKNKVLINIDGKNILKDFSQYVFTKLNREWGR